MRSSSRPIRRGVNARDTRERIRVCWGGSMKIIIIRSSMPSPIISNTVPWAEENRFGSRLAVSTSANRLSAQKSYRSLR